MIAGPVLALFSAPRVDEDGVEFLRTLAAVVALGGSFPLLTLGPGTAALGAADLSPEAERYLDSLAGFGVRPEAADEEALRAALREARAVIRAADPDRRGTPALLAVTDAVVGDPALLARVLEAGQVIRP